MIHAGLQIRWVTTAVQYSKELVFFGTAIFFIFSTKQLSTRSWSFQFLDYLFLLFVLLTVAFLLLPIGEADFFSKATYTKNILLFVVSYFLGRNVSINARQWDYILKLIFLLTLITSIIIVLEKVSGTHLHSLIGFSKYHLDIYEKEPAGPFNLTWTFVAQGGQKRFASLFANPLELSASMLLSISASFLLFVSSKYRVNRRFYLAVLFGSILTVLFAYSRASFVAVFVMLLFMALMLKYFRFLFSIAAIFVLVVLYLITLAPRDIQYFVLDTITFRETSSITHAIEWFEAIESIQAQPLGMGLATSGNAGGVESDIKVGGENQFLVFGVQLGLIGLGLYLAMYLTSIIVSSKVFLRIKNPIIAKIPFTAAATKVGLFLPLMTANAETYLYVSMISWWMVGYSLQLKDQEFYGK
jgi:hypothetical protein